MTALAEALLAAQRSAVGSLTKAYVAGKIDAEVLAAQLDAIGLRDDVDQGLLIDSLTIVKTLGGEAPKAAGAANGAPKEAKPASEAQWKLIRRLADERGQVAPEGPLTVDEASRVIEQLKAPREHAYDPSSRVLGGERAATSVVAALVMDEHREEREELALIAREDTDAIREAAAEREYWQDVGLEPAERVTLETARWSR